MKYLLDAAGLLFLLFWFAIPFAAAIYDPKTGGKTSSGERRTRLVWAVFWLLP